MFFNERIAFTLYSCFSEAATRGVLWKMVNLKLLRNSQRNTCAGVSFYNKVTG